MEGRGERWASSLFQAPLITHSKTKCSGAGKAPGQGGLRVSQELCGLGLGLCLDCKWGKALVSYMLPSGKWPQDGSRGSVGSPAQALSPLTPKEP